MMRLALARLVMTLTCRWPTKVTAGLRSRGRFAVGSGRDECLFQTGEEIVGSP